MAPRRAQQPQNRPGKKGSFLAPKATGMGKDWWPRSASDLLRRRYAVSRECLLCLPQREAWTRSLVATVRNSANHPLTACAGYLVTFGLPVLTKIPFAMRQSEGSRSKTRWSMRQTSSPRASLSAASLPQSPVSPLDFCEEFSDRVASHTDWQGDPRRVVE